MNGTEHPQVNYWPKEDSKFVQLIIDDKYYLRFGESKKYHSHILRNALEEFELGDKETKIPPIRGDGYEAVGMGAYMLFRRLKEIHFYSKSGNYWLKPNKEHLEHIEKPGEEWSFIVY